MPVSVFLADLKYDDSGVPVNDCMPLEIAYMKAVMDRDEPEIRSRLFVYPNVLADAIREDPPDVLLLTNYLWNEAISLYIARLAKQIRREALLVMGGPNLSHKIDHQIEFLRRNSQIDAYIVGEADFLATELVRHFLAAGRSLEKFVERNLPSTLYRKAGGKVVPQTVSGPHRPIHNISSPWLTGLQDEFFDGKLIPTIETHRACTVTRSFCVQGGQWYTKVHRFNKERLREEIHYIARLITERAPSIRTLRIAHSNCSIPEQERDISTYIDEIRTLYGWPVSIELATAQNGAERMTQSLDHFNSALVLHEALQSLEEKVQLKPGPKQP